MIKLCPLCERDVRDHEIILIDGDEGHVCTSSKSGEEAKRVIMDWLVSLDDKADRLQYQNTIKERGIDYE